MEVLLRRGAVVLVTRSRRIRRAGWSGRMRRSGRMRWSGRMWWSVGSTVVVVGYRGRAVWRLITHVAWGKVE
jgi:hypothetical protein